MLTPELSAILGFHCIVASLRLFIYLRITRLGMSDYAIKIPHAILASIENYIIIKVFCFIFQENCFKEITNRRNDSTYILTFYVGFFVLFHAQVRLQAIKLISKL